MRPPSRIGILGWRRKHAAAEVERTFFTSFLNKTTWAAWVLYFLCASTMTLLAALACSSMHPFAYWPAPLTLSQRRREDADPSGNAEGGEEGGCAPAHCRCSSRAIFKILIAWYLRPFFATRSASSAISDT